MLWIVAFAFGCASIACFVVDWLRRSVVWSTTGVWFCPHAEWSEPFTIGGGPDQHVGNITYVNLKRTLTVCLACGATSAMAPREADRAALRKKARA